MQAEAILFTSPKDLKVQILELAGFCKQLINFAFAQPFMGEKPSNAACLKMILDWKHST